MKKTYIAFAVLAMAALAGCQETEFRNDTYIPQEGEVLIRVGNSDKTTKSAEFSSEIKGEIFSLGSDADGTSYFLEETITNLDDAMFAPMTKGTPGYTENFHPLYGGFNAAVYKDGSVYEADGAFEVVDEAKLIYKRKYPNDIWDKDTENTPNLYFFLRTPASYIDANTLDENDNPTLSYNASNGKITFKYTSPAKAEDQKDMLFTSRPLTTADEFNNYFIKADQGLPVLFHHALTGVKFAIAEDVMDHVTITGVTFTGLADGGECVVTPRQETSGYVDDKTEDYSSATVSVWAPEKLTFGGTEFSQTFSGVVSYESAGTGKAHFGESFYHAGNNNNLNNANASETFWFIPQAMTDNVKLTISYKIDGVAQPDWTIDFGTTLKNKNVVWQAGELHTYTIRIDDVNVKIEDEVTVAGAANNGYTGSYKDNVAITNTGNTDAFIRAAIIGQWLNDSSQPVFGFTDRTGSKFETVASWYEDQFVSTAAGVQGEFEGLSGYKGGDNGNNNWYLCEDGYYYYSEPVAPGKIIGTAPEGATNSADYLGNPLFSKYKIKTAPIVHISGVNTAIHFSLEIATQAISAKKIDGSTYEWQDAWENATGTKPTIKTE